MSEGKEMHPGESNIKGNKQQGLGHLFEDKIQPIKNKFKNTQLSMNN